MTPALPASPSPAPTWPPPPTRSGSQVSHDHELPALRGILVEVEPAAVRLVATDRYRLAICEIPVAAVSAPHQVIAPAPFVDRTRALLPGTAEVTLTVGLDRISVQAIELATYPEAVLLTELLASRRWRTFPMPHAEAEYLLAQQ